MWNWVRFAETGGQGDPDCEGIGFVSQKGADPAGRHRVKSVRFVKKGLPGWVSGGGIGFVSQTYGWWDGVVRDWVRFAERACRVIEWATLGSFRRKGRGTSRELER